MSDFSIPHLLAEAAKKLRAEFEFIRNTNPHSGDKGAEAEGIFREFLNNHLPKRFKSAAGTIIDESDQHSRQTDVIIYDQLSSPVYRYSDVHLILPANCVASVMEVKSRLNKKELEDGYAKIASCKKLKKPPLSEMDLSSTGSPLQTISTFGAIVGFGSDTSLATLAQHAQALNSEYPSTQWPSVIAILDQGLIQYCYQFPGASSMGGTMMPSEDNGYPYEPPFFVHLTIQEDGIYTLNRFFLLLLSHLTFFPRRVSTPSFDRVLAHNAKQCTTVCAYQYNEKQQLVAVEPLSEPLVLIPTITISRLDGEVLGGLQYFGRSGGGVLRWKGNIPSVMIFTIIKTLMPGVPLQGLAHDDAEYTTVLPLNEAIFTQWPAEINKHLTGMTARLHRYQAAKVADIGVSDAFLARMFASMFQLRDQAGVNRDQFDEAYSAVIAALISLHVRLNPQSSLAPLLRTLSEPEDQSKSQADETLSKQDLGKNVLDRLASFAHSFEIDLSFLTQSKPEWDAGVAACYAKHPTFATYLLGAQHEFVERLNLPASDHTSDITNADWQQLANLVEITVAVVLRSRLSQSLILREIPRSERNSEFPRRFEIVLRNGSTDIWQPQYDPFYDT